MFLMPVFWLLIFVGIVFVVVAAAQSSGGASASSSDDSALDILSKRYARGEIDTVEFEEKRKGLSGK